MQTVVWLLVSALVIVWTQRRPSLLVTFVLITYLSVPSVARGIFVGAGVPLHPGTILALLALFFVSITRTRSLVKSVSPVGAKVFFLSLLVSHAAIVTLAGTGVVGLLMNVLVGPISLLILVLVAFHEEGRIAGDRIGKGMLFMAALQAILAIIQVTQKRTIFYEDQYPRFYWFSAERFSRGLGTLDSALDLSFLLVVAIPLCLLLRRISVRLALATLLTIGVFTTQSRMGVLLALLGLAFVVVRGGNFKVRFFAAVGMVVALGFILNSSFGKDFISRAENASGSTSRRMEALEFIVGNVFENAVIGGGLNSSYGLKQSSILGSSLENGWAMYAYDFGWVAALLYLLILVSVLVSGLLSHEWMSSTMLALAIIMVSGYSSIMTQGSSSVLTFLIAGLVMGGVNNRDVSNVFLQSADTELVDLSMKAVGKRN
ncbi:MAG: O-antigen ligase family protein [Arthrobacter sp.]